MILIDFSQIIFSNLFAICEPEDDDLENELRISTLERISRYKKRFKKFGDVVICVDDKHYWRRDIFPYYKAGRRREREKSKFDWNTIYESLNKIKEEIKLYFPYKVMDVPLAEADDIIGVLAKHNHTVENILILSGDKDFLQLQKYPNITQFSTVHNTFIKTPSPQETLREHIMTGDSGDGIPNFLSPDDVFTSGRRQSPISKEKLARWIKEESPENFCDLKMLRGYKRNQQLIDLEMIPIDIQNAIISEWDKEFIPNRKKMLLEYCRIHKLANLMDSIQDF